MMYNDEFSNTGQWSVCGFPECENRFSMLNRRYMQSEAKAAYTDEVIKQNSLLKSKEEQLQKQLEEENANNEEMRIKLLGYMKAQLPLEEERNNYLTKYDELKKKYDELNLSKSAVNMHNKQLSELVAEQDREKKLQGATIIELKEEIKLLKKEMERSLSERKKTETSCRSAIESIVKEAELLKSKKLLPGAFTRKLNVWKKMLEKLTNDSTNHTSESSSSSSDSSDDSDIEAMGDLLQKHLVSTEEQDYLSTDKHIESVDIKAKTFVEIGTNTDGSDSTFKLNVGVQTLIEAGIERTVIQKSIFSPEPNLKKAEIQTQSLPCDSDQMVGRSGRISVCSNFSSSDELCFESSAEPFKDQNVTKSCQMPASTDCRSIKSPSAAKIYENLEKLCGSNLSTEEIINQFNNFKKLYALETFNDHKQVLQHLKEISSHLYKKKNENIRDSNKNIYSFPNNSNISNRRLKGRGRPVKRSNFGPITLSCKSDIPIEHQAIASKLQLVSEFSEFYKIPPVVTTHSSKLVSDLREVSSRPCSIFNKVNKDTESKIEKEIEIEMAKIKLEIMTQLRKKYSEILKRNHLPVTRNGEIPSTKTIKRKSEDSQNLHKIKRYKIISEMSEDCKRTLTNPSSSGTFTVTPCNTVSCKNEVEKPLKKKRHSHLKFINKRHIYPKVKKRNKHISMKRKQKSFEHSCYPKSHELFSKKKVDKSACHIDHETPQTISKECKSSQGHKLHNLPSVIAPQIPCPQKKAYQGKIINFANVWINIKNCKYVPMDMPQSGLFLKNILDEIKNMNFESNNAHNMSLNRTVSELTPANLNVLNDMCPEINTVEINVSHFPKDNVEQSEQHASTDVIDSDEVTPSALLVSSNEEFGTNTNEDMKILMHVVYENLNICENSDLSGIEPLLDETVFTEMDSSDGVSANYNISSSENISVNETISIKSTEVEHTAKKCDHRNSPICTELENPKIICENSSVLHISSETKNNCELEKANSERENFSTGNTPHNENSLINTNKLDLQITRSENMNKSLLNLYKPNSDNKIGSVTKSLLKDAKKLSGGSKVRRSLRLSNSTPKCVAKFGITEAKKRKRVREENMNKSLINLYSPYSDKLGSATKSLQEDANQLSEGIKVRRSLRLLNSTPKLVDKLGITEARQKNMNKSFLNFHKSNSDNKLSTVTKSLQKDAGKLSERSKVRRSLRLLNSTPKSVDKHGITDAKKIKRVRPENINTSFVNLNNLNSDNKLSSVTKSLQKDANKLSEGNKFRRSLRLVNSTSKSVDKPGNKTYFLGNSKPNALKVLHNYDTDCSLSKVLPNFSRRRKEIGNLSSVPNKVATNRRYKNQKIKLNGQLLILSLECGKLPLETPVSQTSCNIGQIREIIKKYLCNKLNFKYAFKKLQNLSDLHSLSKCIFQSVYQDSLQALRKNKYFGSHLTNSQQKLVVLIDILREHSVFKNLADNILILIENFILCLNPSTLEEKRLLHIGQFYGDLCRLEQSLKRANTMCYDALHCLGEKGYTFIYGIFITFPEAMPTAVIGKESPKCAAMAHIILSTKQHKSKITKKLKTLLRDHYGYQATSLIFDDPDFNIVEKLQETMPSMEIYATLLLLAKNRGYDWAVNTLIKKILLPVIIAWRFRKIEDNVAEEVIDLISAVSLAYLDDHDFTQEMKILADILENSQSSLKFEMTVAESLARMVKNNFKLVANSLYNWTPNGQVSELFLRNLGHLLHVCPYKRWTSFIKSTVRKRLHSSNDYCRM